MLFSIILLIILILINGIFSATELAFLSIDKIKLKQDIESGNKKAISINKILSSNNMSTGSPNESDSNFSVYFSKITIKRC